LSFTFKIAEQVLIPKITFELAHTRFLNNKYNFLQIADDEKPQQLSEHF
jgi:hypothetical protein